MGAVVGKKMKRRPRKGIFLVLEGPDGGGKKTQTMLLHQRLTREGYEAPVADFPRYGHPSAGPVELYLRGELGGHVAVEPHHAAVLYAVDRYCAASEINRWLREGKVVLSNRYTVSNLAYQGAKIKDSAERRKFWEWNREFEHDFMKVPRPTLNIILDVPIDIAYALIGEKEQRSYLKGKKRDIHEQDKEYLRRTVDVYHELARTYPDEFKIVPCAQDGKLLSREAIAERLWHTVKPLLA